MAVLSIKDFDDELDRNLKSAAALQGITKQEMLENLVADGLGLDRPSGTPTTKRATKKGK